jgi:hypothetical protein
MIVVEVLDRRGRVAQRARLADLPAVLGRGYDCAVVLDDPHVEARHAEVRLDEPGGVVVRDLGTVNGTWRAGSGERGAGSGEIALGSGGAVRLGATTVRLLTPAFPVLPARALVTRSGLVGALERPRTAAAVTVAALVIAVVNLWLGDSSASGLAELTSTGLGLVLAVAAWAGVWAFAGRVNVHRPAFLAHAAVTLTAVVALELVWSLLAYADIVLDASRLADALMWITATAAALAVVFLQLGLATLQPARTRLLRAVAVVAVVWGLSEALERADQESPAYADTEMALRPVPAGLPRAPDADDLLARTGALRRELEALARKDAGR